MKIEKNHQNTWKEKVTCGLYCQITSQYGYLSSFRHDEKYIILFDLEKAFALLGIATALFHGHLP